MKGVGKMFHCKKKLYSCTLRLGAVCRVVPRLQFRVGIGPESMFPGIHSTSIISPSSIKTSTHDIESLLLIYSNLNCPRNMRDGRCLILASRKVCLLSPNLVKSALVGMQFVLRPIHPFFSSAHPPPILILECPGSDSYLRQVRG